MKILLEITSKLSFENEIFNTYNSFVNQPFASKLA
jgi:hypothetical protein